MARSVVEEGLAACVHIGPVTSVYRWEGKIAETREWSCQMKTFPARVPALFDRIRALHTYQVPEILAVPITAVAPTYLQWMAESGRDS